ncbi:MAG: hypothetical protein EOM77_03615 [Bacteroidia bacterium]|nr:hypothetical protein [Bacteroidia bacterium]
MKRKKTIWLSTALLALLVPCTKILIDSYQQQNLALVDAGRIEYEVRLDSLNTPAEIPSTPDLEDAQMHTYSPSRYVAWGYGGPAVSYEEAHMAFDYSTGSYTMGALFNENLGFKGLVSLSLDYSISGSFDSCYLYMDDEFGTTPLENRVNLASNTTFPLVLDAAYFASYTSSMYFRLSMYSSYGGIFILYSLVITYTCYQG